MNATRIDRRNVLGGALTTAGFGLAAGPSRAAGKDYPDGNVIHSVAMFPPGSGADIKIRFYANKLAEKLDATVVVDNKAGALGYIATEYVAHAKPDGLTIYIAGQFHARGGT